MPAIRHGDVTLEAPDHWQDRSQIMLMGPYLEAQKTRPMVALGKHELIDPQSAADYGRGFTANLPAVLQDCRILEEGALSLEGTEAYRLVVEFKPGEARRTTRYQLFVTRGRDLYILTADTPSEAFDQLRPAVEGIMRSFRLSGSR